MMTKVAIALGLALLLVVGAWSASHGEADAHAALCLAPGVSEASAGAARDGDEITVVDALSADSGGAVAGALCCFLLVLLLRRMLVAVRVGAGTRGPGFRSALPCRAGPRRLPHSPSLLQLSISRT